MNKSESIEHKVKHQLPNNTELEKEVAVTKALLSNVVDNELPHIKTDIREMRGTTRYTLWSVIGGIVLGILYILIRGML